MEALGLPHLSSSPLDVLYSQCRIAIARFECCEICLPTGKLRILPLDEKSVAVEGISSMEKRRFLIYASQQSWRLSSSTAAAEFHTKLGADDTPLIHIAQAIHKAYRAGHVRKISSQFAKSVRDELIQKPLVLRGEGRAGTSANADLVHAWNTVDSILNSPTAPTRLEQPIVNGEGKTTHHLIISYQVPNNRFILEMWPHPRPFDSRPSESLTITAKSISHFDPDGPEPFSSMERGLEVFAAWMRLRERGD